MPAKPFMAPPSICRCESSHDCEPESCAPMSPDWWYTYMRSSSTGFQLTGSPAALNVKPSARGCPQTGSMPR